MEVKIGISNRHVHVTRELLNTLYGDNYELTIRNELSQKGQFASNETVTIKTDKGFIENVRILGPIRNYNQVEISKTDAYKLGLNPPVRESGDIKNSEKITVIGPKGEAFIEGCIIATRHIHISPDDAKRLGLHGKKVSVKIEGEKGGILENVSIKEDESYTFELHLDTDDANAHFVKQGDICKIII